MGSERRGLDTVAAWAEIIGGVAVVASLLYVGNEVRRSTAATQAATYQEVVNASNGYLLALASDSALAEIVGRAEADPRSLSEAEGRRYLFYSRVFWRNMDNAFVQHRRGVLAEPEWEVYRGIACERRTSPPAWMWDLHREVMSPDFVVLMDEC